MLGYIRDKAKHLIITLRFSILFIFATLFVITILTLLSIFYYHIYEVVQRAALLIMDRAAYSISQEVSAKFKPAETDGEFTTDLIRHQVLNIHNPEQMTTYLSALLQKLPLSDGMHWADVDGDFIYAGRNLDGSIFTQVINKRVNPPTNTLFYRDRNNKEVKRVSNKIDFDPRKRVWFVAALKQKHTVWIDVTIRQHKPFLLAITVASPAYNANGTPLGAFGIDLRLDYLSRYIAKEKISENSSTIIVNNQAQIIAAPELIALDVADKNKNELKNIHSISKPWVAHAFDIYQRTHQTLFKFKYNNMLYLASFKPITLLAGNHWIIAIVTPTTDFTRHIHHIELSYVFLFLGIFTLGVLLMSNLVSRIVTPIKKLVRETKKIKNFDLEESERVQSRIKEVIELSDSIYGMKLGLRSFQKYVPASLVRQLILTGEDARIEGYKREMVIFYSDIANFTAISEKVDSNELVKQICVYMEALSRVITDNLGTIDKYIGDSVMAFWGAPLIVHEPCQLAARAALKGMKFLELINEQWNQENKPLFITRMGFHFGDTIVGNIGSSERLNYTALGDTVNIASRLVSANKIYGTSILVTETVYHQIKDIFVLRMVDQVKFKGKRESTAIYELLAENKHLLLFDIDKYTHVFAQAFSAYQAQKWNTAIKLFNACWLIYPKDKLAAVFIKRCDFFNLNPPPSDWNGVWHFSEK